MRIIADDDEIERWYLRMEQSDAERKERDELARSEYRRRLAEWCVIAPFALVVFILLVHHFLGTPFGAQ